MNRLYLSLAKEHFSEVTQMLFLSGARQVGKATVARQTQEISEDVVYLNWDIAKDRAIITEAREVYALMHSVFIIIYTVAFYIMSKLL